MSGKSKVTLIPTHPAWPAFHAALGERLQADPLRDQPCVCSHRATMPKTLQALTAIGLAQRDVLRTRESFRAHGLTCDCAVWQNPEILLMEPEEERPVWLDEDGNFDANAYCWHEIRPHE